MLPDSCFIIILGDMGRRRGRPGREGDWGR